MDTEDEDIDIQPDNVIEGVQLLILHAALCLTMFLVGLVSTIRSPSSLGNRKALLEECRRLIHSRIST
jgi:hypothetical protein